MEEKNILGKVIAAFPEAGFELVEENTDHPYLVVPAESLLDVCRLLKDDGELQLNTLTNLSCVDEGENLTMVYHLFSYQLRHYAVLKVRTPRTAPEIPSVQPIWTGAGWFEREAFDLMGIAFTGHKDLRRIMMPDDWVGHPLRKDYQELEEYHGIGTSRTDPLEIVSLADADPADKDVTGD
jgi:NADH-quinone oxidoreductase subunit C